MIITMPSLVSDLTPLQRAWLYENQRTFMDEKYACNPSDAEFRVAPSKSKTMNKSSIFRNRDAGSNEVAVASSPSWNAAQEMAGEPRLSAVATDSGENSSAKKRRKVHPPSYTAPREGYYDYTHPGHSFQHTSPYPPYNQPQSPRYPATFHPPHHNYHHRPPPFHQEIYLDTPQAPIKPSKRAGRDESPSTDQVVYPAFVHQGDKLTWNESYENLVVYKSHYGDCNVPQKYKGNLKLGGWVNKQRKKNRNPTKYGTLKKDHLDLLTTIGFKWE